MEKRIANPQSVALKMISFNALKRNYSQLRSDLRSANLKRVFILAKALPDFLRERITVQRAEEEIKRALSSREDRFLETVRAQVYKRPSSPYLRLLKYAGCEFSDLRTYIHQHGLEGTLEQLAREGVYLTADEFKGKKEVLRGADSFLVSPMDLNLQDHHQDLSLRAAGQVIHLFILLSP